MDNENRRQSEKKNYGVYGLVGLLVVAAFVIGSLYTKVSVLEKGIGSGAPNQAGGGEVQPTPKYKTLNEALKDYSKQIGIDGNKLTACVDSGEKKAIVDAEQKEGEGLSVQGTPAFFINGRFVGGAFPYEAFQEIIDKELAGKGSSNYKDYSDDLQKAYTGGKAFDPEPKKIEVGNAPVQGENNAKVTIVEFSDFQCPFCGRSYPTIKKVLSDYKGKVRFAYKQFPLNSIHPKAQKAAEASQCARDQGKFWELHDKLFENQTEWAT
ncbi:hypothetical protein A2960_05590 [Candidatus Gottesmanbacteria bacterium RIFCSPLOWO2_01_FULL_39_12b]|uniref:Thioredoxin domain-containing protein n=1 Tax=Candidatus Gottesmanbacteria bacterium RIFCSPLOWO2_01_FULL_39_12b TaxID=1798388 RepID=A0A1F6AMS2_9BACT|nr:MAG: hypothetical protein A2960_05590 [Candidatus Gottesmanbacteria bacterium RIFCSPLOWO2_01_FULL_39_12b]